MFCPTHRNARMQSRSNNDLFEERHMRLSLRDKKHGGKRYDVSDALLPKLHFSTKNPTDGKPESCIGPKSDGKKPELVRYRPPKACSNISSQKHHSNQIECKRMNDVSDEFLDNDTFDFVHFEDGGEENLEEDQTNLMESNLFTSKRWSYDQQGLQISQTQPQGFSGQLAGVSACSRRCYDEKTVVIMPEAVHIIPPNNPSQGKNNSVWEACWNSNMNVPTSMLISKSLEPDSTLQGENSTAQNQMLMESSFLFQNESQSLFSYQL